MDDEHLLQEVKDDLEKLAHAVVVHCPFSSSSCSRPSPVSLCLMRHRYFGDVGNGVCDSGAIQRAECGIASHAVQADGLPLDRG